MNAQILALQKQILQIESDWTDRLNFVRMANLETQEKLIALLSEAGIYAEFHALEVEKADRNKALVAERDEQTKKLKALQEELKAVAALPEGATLEDAPAEEDAEEDAEEA